MTNAPEIIRELVEQFETNLRAYKSPTYKEEQLKHEFLNKFFKALGWDVYNEKNAAPQHRDVIFEDSIKIGGGTKAPDYCFTLAGKRMFFVEAKKPSVDIKKDIHPAFQLRRYAWSAKLPLSILTDFEEFAVYETRTRPQKEDKAGTGRVMYLTYKDYIDQWDEIASRFSYDAVVQGYFDRFAETTEKKRGTQEVDSEFLKEIESWRELLAKNIALRNPDVSIYELNYAVQKIIDRIIFLRICEDRGIEPYGQLQTKAVESTDVYTHLRNHFRLAESKYNSGIFDFDSDGITPSLTIDDKVLKTIIQALYYPKSPYEFSVLGVEILGNVYEQFLGKVIRLTAGHQAKVETKPEVKKAGGVYYTPQYIVEYIVENTVGKSIAGKTPEEIAEIKVLDPACGSGSFLIGAYTYLLRYHLDWYVSNKPKKHKGKMFQAKENEWYLTTAEKKRILLNNIFGVDIDPQAVEVTKLSLLLKVLEHESRESIDQQMKLRLEGVLPNLEDNIKCGNSLIGPEYYEQQQETLFDEEEMRRVNVFDWEDERKGFGGIMRKGGFDCVVGNPPYRMLQPHNTTSDILDYLRQHFFAADFKIDFFHIFLQKGVSLLLEENAFLGFIVPVTLLNNVYIKSLRHWLTDKCCIDSISVANNKVFTADVHTCVVVLRTEPDVQKRGNNEIHTTVDFNKSFVYQNNQSFYRTTQTDFFRLPGYVWNVLINNENSQLIFRMIENNEHLGEIGKINRGLITGNRKKYFSKVKQSGLHVPIIAGADVFRYFSNQPSEFVLFDRPPSAGGCWDKEVHHAPHKIVIRQIGHKPTASLIQQPLAVTGNIFTIRFDNLNQEMFVLGIINSKLIKFFWKIMFTDFKTSFPQVTIFSLSQIPICKIDFSNPAEKAQHDKLVALVESMLELQKKYHDARMDQDKELYERQIKMVDAQIDKLVYDLYGLTEEEVKVVETY
uniref:site-specific DNA-methyltransferase (adenine-specific) n=1 Tax=Candidatus Methanophaga sp. ANME-1 ERB7 TaxID=2759913 RepID=A0A7G9Z7T8_9EURY|nr:hypothetical protein HFIEAGJK_00039 [Methanosarcinales archaeon ANME-1 ERB7]